MTYYRYQPRHHYGPMLQHLLPNPGAIRYHAIGEEPPCVRTLQLYVFSLQVGFNLPSEATGFDPSREVVPDTKDNSTVFIGGLHEYVEPWVLARIMGMLGATGPIKVYHKEKIAFIEYVVKHEASEAIRLMQGYPLGNMRLRLAWGKDTHRYRFSQQDYRLFPAAPRHISMGQTRFSTQPHTLRATAPMFHMRSAPGHLIASPQQAIPEPDALGSATAVASPSPAGQMTGPSSARTISRDSSSNGGTVPMPSTPSFTDDYIFGAFGYHACGVHFQRRCGINSQSDSLSERELKESHATGQMTRDDTERFIALE